MEKRPVKLTIRATKLSSIVFHIISVSYDNIKNVKYFNNYSDVEAILSYNTRIHWPELASLPNLKQRMNNEKVYRL